MRRSVSLTLLGITVATLAFPNPIRAGADDDIRIEAVVPSRVDSILVCNLRTRGLPDHPSRETLSSGLPSALVLAFSLVDASGDDLGGSLTEIRIEPDLWEEIMLVRTPLVDRRLASLDEVGELLRHLGPLPVLPMARLPRGLTFRIRVRLAVYPIAPAEIERVHALFGGGPSESEADRREVSVGLSSLVRYFLGDQPDEDWVADATSGPFTRQSLAEAP